MTLRWAVLLACLLPWLQVSAQKPAPERIGGTVINAITGRPVAAATLTLQTSRSEQILASVRSGEDGAFRFDPVPTGRYRLHATAKGYAAAFYLEHGTFFSAIVTGAGLATGSLQMQLTPAASISGRVLDEAGDPLPLRGTTFSQGANVTLYCEDPTAPKPIQTCNAKQAEEDGSYEFRDLKPGRYYLGVEARPWYEVHPNMHAIQAGSLPYRSAVDPALDVAYPRVFYPSALTSSQAEPIVVKAGDEFTANLQMVPEKALTIAIPQSRDPNWTFPFVMTEIFGSPEAVSPMMDKVDNVGYIMGLPQGHYTLKETRRGSQFVERTRTVDLSDQAVTLEAVPFSATAPVSLSLRTPAGAPVPAHTSVLLQGKGVLSPNASTDDQGVATLPRVPEGDYQVSMGSQLVVVRLSVNGQVVANKHLQVAAGEPVKGEATVAPAVTVEGVARAAGKPAPGRMVLLVPASADISPDLFRRDQTDLDGGFTLLNVVPGRYLLMALDQGWNLPWTDIHALEPYLLHAQPLVVPATSGDTLRLPAPVVTQSAH